MKHQNHKTVKFVSTIPGVADMFPIKLMSELRPEWANKARAEYKTLDKSIKQNHISLCPGIFDLLKLGWYVPMWYDVYVTTKKDIDGFEWKIANSALTDLAGFSIMGTHGDQIGKFIPKRDKQLDHVVKINTPYHIIAPPDLKFLFLPMPYPEHFDWESTSGVLEPATSSELNVQLNWNVKEGERFIKAGTPLMQIIPLSENNIDMECREANEKELRWINKRPYFNSFSFSPIRNKIKDLYNNYFLH